MFGKGLESYLICKAAPCVFGIRGSGALRGGGAEPAPHGLPLAHTEHGDVVHRVGALRPVGGGPPGTIQWERDKMTSNETV